MLSDTVIFQTDIVPAPRSVCYNVAVCRYIFYTLLYRYLHFFIRPIGNKTYILDHAEANKHLCQHPGAGWDPRIESQQQLRGLRILLP
jgi:hypothetical protein